MITLDQVLAAEALIALAVWAGATWRWRGHWYDGKTIGSLLWLIVVAGVIAFSARSLLPNEVIAGYLIAMVRGLYILGGMVIWWHGPPK